jgi:hypothetical protein
MSRALWCIRWIGSGSRRGLDWFSWTRSAEPREEYQGQL